MTDQARLLANAAVPSFICPPGTKMHILDLGTLQVDEGWFINGANSSSASNKNPENKQRDLIVIAALIEHPKAGLVLFETGCPEDIDLHWGPPVTDIFPRTKYEESNKLPTAIKATGNDIKDVKAVIIGHLHLDHAGGLEHFIDTDVPIYVHEDEFKHACWAVGTGADLGAYLAHYMQLQGLKWQTFTDHCLELFQGITLYHTPGHTPGLVIMQVNLEKDGCFIWTTDQFHVAENYELGIPHGWLVRDHTAWVRSLHMVRRLQRMYDANLIFGHDRVVAQKFLNAKKFYE
ncbi:hypothetical protein BHE90_015291 [Fusarium euwallaceae]|uniref:Metallo-beta-lactamase domain-containing protein n=1 Tax=Fusarium euwallaceae TaxID=1147111 RepID=A0A430L3K8_9HYPO|nr:hypothetical protein BHE90_015291 [Fusarium euwallaceae]